MSFNPHDENLYADKRPGFVLEQEKQHVTMIIPVSIPGTGDGKYTVLIRTDFRFDGFSVKYTEDVDFSGGRNTTRIAEMEGVRVLRSEVVGIDANFAIDTISHVVPRVSPDLFELAAIRSYSTIPAAPGWVTLSESQKQRHRHLVAVAINTIFDKGFLLDLNIAKRIARVVRAGLRMTQTRGAGYVEENERSVKALTKADLRVLDVIDSLESR